ncbi:13954_t:CDS:2 [Funneliformis geosporum]|uniref:13954_t:CDS:1 n=1 Tax=Funneliformis geosporum TaxID=1117311 RepID=A0A9W4WPU7_9GLOM|nr:13954_t:CDS:2 [Funneliformis geosporum]
MPQLFIEKQAKIFALLKEGYQCNIIISKEGVHKFTFTRIHQRKEEIGALMSSVTEVLITKKPSIIALIASDSDYKLMIMLALSIIG